jgi:hypothetical protein
MGLRQRRRTVQLRYSLRPVQASVETDQATAARELLDLVDRAEYLPEPIRLVEIDAAIDALTAAHNGLNNFYNEPVPARALENLVGAQGSCP